MRFAAVFGEFLRVAPAAVASPAALGTWTRVYAHAAAIEKQGRIPACAGYDDRQWLALAQVTPADVSEAVAGGLLIWEGADLIVVGYDLGGEAKVNAARENGRKPAREGRRRGRPPKNDEKPNAKPNKNPRVSSWEAVRKPSENPSSVSVSVSGSGSGEEAEAPKRADPLSARQPAVLVFPASGQVSEWNLTEEWVAVARAAFPAVDVVGEMRLALAKIKNGACRKPTAKGMSRFLMIWLGRTNDRQPPLGSGQGGRAVGYHAVVGEKDWNAGMEKVGRGAA